MDILDQIVLVNSPLLILAGPGMGKTYTLAYKIKHLVKNKDGEKIKPDEITVITFTNEAAINMRKRISSDSDEKVYIEQELQPSVICTMHKLGHRIIKDNYSELGLENNFNVLSSGYLKDVLIKDCSQIVGAERNHAKETITCRQEGKCTKTESLKCNICSEYKKLLRKFNYIDHDDQVLLACELLKNNKNILQREQTKARYLLVDEYQDINYAQWELINLLSTGKTENLFVVGDDYQSIYGFRGGSPKYIRNFVNDYAPNAEVHRLTVSRRCPPHIFKGAFHMVHKYNSGDIKFLENLEFKNKGSSLINVCEFKHHNLEADFIARKVREIGPSYDVLILVPDYNFSKPIKSALRKKFIDFSCDFDLEKTELYLITVLLNWLKNKSDNFNLRVLIEDIINRGLSDIPGKQTEFVGTEDNKNKREIAFRQISNFWKEVGKKKTLYMKLKTLKKDDSFKKLIDTITLLKDVYGQENDTAIFLSTIIKKLNIWKNISNFSDELNSIVEEIKGLTMISGECSVRVLTIRKAKGLEADYVFIVGLENNILPRNTGLEEDSRLLYVSMTRAKKELYLLHSEIRDRNITKVKTAGRSEFINAIPTEFKNLL